MWLGESNLQMDGFRGSVSHGSSARNQLLRLHTNAIEMYAVFYKCMLQHVYLQAGTHTQTHTQAHTQTLHLQAESSSQKGQRESWEL